MMFSDNCLALVRQFEGCRLKAYQDQGGIWSLGYGYTYNVKEGDTCSQAQADAWLEDNLVQACNGVKSHVTVNLNQNQLDALTSFVYNIGIGHFISSTMISLLNANKVDIAANEFPKWDHVDGQVSLGLLNRRYAEQALFLQVP